MQLSVKSSTCSVRVLPDHRCHTAASNRQVIRMDGILFHSMLSVHLVVNLIVFRNYMHLQSCSMYALHSGTASHLD